MKSSAADLLAQQICNTNWSLSSKAAVKLLCSRIPCYASPSQERVTCSIWLTAAALSGSDSVMESDENPLTYGSYSLMTACRTYYGVAEPPETVQIVQNARDVLV